MGPSLSQGVVAPVPHNPRPWLPSSPCVFAHSRYKVLEPLPGLHLTLSPFHPIYALPQAVAPAAEQLLQVLPGLPSIPPLAAKGAWVTVKPGSPK